MALALVTGAEGYVGSHVVKLLLSQGLRVRGTVRSLKNPAQFDALRKFDSDGRLELVEADLLNADAWKKTVHGVDFVHHVASPFPLHADDSVVTTALNGTLNVLKAVAKTHSVQKVVLTSSIVAVIGGHNHDHVFSEKDWTITDGGVDLYSKSKTVAERAAWKLLAETPKGDNKFRLSTVNPVLVVGPPIFPDRGSSVTVVKNVLETSPKSAIPALPIPTVDVRDVARMHYEAMNRKEADGLRFIASSQPTTLASDIGKWLHEKFGDLGHNVPVQDWIGPATSLFTNNGKDEKNPLEIDNSQAERVLGVKCRHTKETLIEMAEQLLRLGVVKKKN